MSPGATLTRRLMPRRPSADVDLNGVGIVDERPHEVVEDCSCRRGRDAIGPVVVIPTIVILDVVVLGVVVVELVFEVVFDLVVVEDVVRFAHA